MRKIFRSMIGNFVERPVRRAFHDRLIDFLQMLCDARKDAPCEIRLIDARREFLQIALENFGNVLFLMIKIPLIESLQNNGSDEMPCCHGGYRVSSSEFLKSVRAKMTIFFRTEDRPGEQVSARRSSCTRAIALFSSRDASDAVRLCLLYDVLLVRHPWEK